MGKKLIIPGADFSENCIIIPLTIVVKAGGSVNIGGVEYSAPAGADKEYEIDSVPSNFSLNYEDDIKYIRIGSSTIIANESGDFRDNQNLEEAIFAATISTSAIASVLFANCPKLKKFDGTNLMYNAENGSMLFLSCTSLTEVKLGNFKYPITNFSYCFSECSNLKKVEFDNTLSLSDSPTMTGMFANCPALEDIYAPSLVASDYNVSGTNTYKFIQGIGATTGHVKIHCGTGTLTWNGSSWSVS